MMLDWNDYRRQLAAGVKEIGQLSPDTIKGYMGPQRGWPKDGSAWRESPRTHRSCGGRHLALRRLHYGSYRGCNQTRRDQGRDCGSARSRHDRQRRGALVYSARVMDAFNEYPSAASPREPDSLANLRR
jgi:hypothetical protein